MTDRTEATIISKLSETTRNKLKTVSTATVATALFEIANEAFEMTVFEDFVAEQVRTGRGIFGLYPATDEQTLKDFAVWRKEKGR